MSKEELISSAYEEFSKFEKPKHSTNYKHCEECKGYDDLLEKITCRELTMDQIGTVCWGPVAFLLPEAMAYYLPRFIELALNNVLTKDNDPYINQFINQIGSDPDREAFSLLEIEHKKLILKAYQYINENYRDIVEYNCWEEDLDEAIKNWSA